MLQDGFGHESPYCGATNDWITPKWIFDAFNSVAECGMYFDLDPCASLTQPWVSARKSYTVEQDGLSQGWWGNVWLNPPYGQHTITWVSKLIKHGTGIALIFARVETKLWQDGIFPSADGFLFPKRRIQFARPDGTIPKSSSGAPSALIAWGGENRNTLIELCDKGIIEGAFLEGALCSKSYKLEL